VLSPIAVTLFIRYLSQYRKRLKHDEKAKSAVRVARFTSNYIATNITLMQTKISQKPYSILHCERIVGSKF
jgi:hypothetical protein